MDHNFGDSKIISRAGEIEYTVNFSADEMDLIHECTSVFASWLQNTLEPFPDRVGEPSDQDPDVDIAEVVRPAMYVRVKELRSRLISLVGFDMAFHPEEDSSNG